MNRGSPSRSTWRRRTAPVTALLPLLTMVFWLAVYEARATAPPEPVPATSVGIALPVLAAPRPAAGVFRVLEGSLAVAVSDPFRTVVDRVAGVGGDVLVGDEHQVQRVDVQVDLAALAAHDGTAWQVEALYALRDAAHLAKARFVADQVVAKATQVPGVQALECDGTLVFHGRQRRLQVELLAVAARRDSLRVQGEIALDVRTFGLPRSWRYGFVPMDPVVTVFVDLSLQRDKAN